MLKEMETMRTAESELSEYFLCWIQKKHVEDSH